MPVAQAVRPVMWSPISDAAGMPRAGSMKPSVQQFHLRFAQLGPSVRGCRAALRDRWMGGVALFAYLFGSLGLAAPAAIRPASAVRVGCCCPAADVDSGVCCCAGKSNASSCCSNSTAVRPTRQGAAVHIASMEARTSSCCQGDADKERAGFRLLACPCGQSAADEYLLCGDPRLTADGAAVLLIGDHAQLALPAVPLWSGKTDRPPIPPPRTLCG